MLQKLAEQLSSNNAIETMEHLQGFHEEYTRVVFSGSDLDTVLEIAADSSANCRDTLIEAIEEKADSEADIYNDDRLAWLAMDMDNVSMVNEVLEEYGIHDIIQAIGAAQSRAFSRGLVSIAEALSAFSENQEAIGLFVSEGADPTELLLGAISSKDNEMACFLLSKGADASNEEVQALVEEEGDNEIKRTIESGLLKQQNHESKHSKHGSVSHGL